MSFVRCSIEHCTATPENLPVTHGWRMSMLKNFEYAATVATAFAAHLLVISTALLA